MDQESSYIYAELIYDCATGETIVRKYTAKEAEVLEEPLRSVVLAQLANEANN